MKEWVEKAHRVAPSADACNRCSRKVPLTLQYLPPSLNSYDALEVSHHSRIWVRTYNRPYEVVCVLNVRHPVSQRFVNRVLQGSRPGTYRVNSRTQHLHPIDVELLPLHVLLSHVDLCSKSKGGACHRRGHSVLACSRLRNDSRLSHPFREQCLAQGVVDLVRSAVEEVLAFEIDFRAS